MTKRKKILFIVSRLPINIETGDRLRVYHFIKRLSERGHQVDIIGFVPQQQHEIRTDITEASNRYFGIAKKGLEFTDPQRLKQLQLFFDSFLKAYPYRVHQWKDDAFVDSVRSLIRKTTYDVIHFSEVGMGIALNELKKEFNHSRIVFDLIDSVALSLNNSLSQEISWLWPFRFVEKLRLKKFEQQIVANVDEAVLISKRDKAFLERDEITVIPNGIEENELGERNRDIDLLFTGNMAAEANIDAVQWFVNDILPKILLKNPDLHFTIVGAHPTESVKALQSDSVTVTGFVQDINEYYRRAKLFVCPMRLGAGQKNKILEAMINHTAVISTTEGNTGVDAPDEAISTADDAEAFSDAVISLLKDDGQRIELAENGYNYAQKTFSWEKSVDLLEQCYEG